MAWEELIEELVPGLTSDGFECAEHVGHECFERFEQVLREIVDAHGERRR